MDIYREIVTPNTSESSFNPKDDPSFNWVGLLYEYHMQNSTAYGGKPQFTIEKTSKDVATETCNMFKTQVTMWTPNNKARHDGEGVGATKKISKQAAAKDIIVTCLGYEQVIKTHHARNVEELEHAQTTVGKSVVSELPKYKKLEKEAKEKYRCYLKVARDVKKRDRASALYKDYNDVYKLYEEAFLEPNEEQGTTTTTRMRKKRRVHR